MIIAGIGSRSTPPDAIDCIESIANSMARDGVVLRTGGATGADAAFERAYRKLPDATEPQVFIPWYGFNKLKGSGYINCQTIPTYGVASEIASRFHPNWANCSRGPRALHARNVYIMLGYDLNTPVDKVYCWTPGGRITGGTGQALRLAKHYEIPIINLADSQSWKSDFYVLEYLEDTRASFSLGCSS